MKLKKGSPEAKAYMAKIRKKRKIGATQGDLFKQTFKSKQRGTSNLEMDKKRKAKAPGSLTGIGSIKTDLQRKLTAAQNNLAALMGKYAETKQLATATKSKTAKAALPTIRKKIVEARKIVAVLKKAAK